MIWALKIHGKRWLGLTSGPMGDAARGWRPYRWVKDFADAEKFASRPAAELFLRGLPALERSGAVEIVAIPAAPVRREEPCDDGA